MMLTISEVEHIAELARLSLTPEEKERYRQQLSAVLEYVAHLQEVDTSQIPPTSSVLPPRSVLRTDRAVEFPGRDALLKNAPRLENNQYRVPPVLE
ncbi:MAG TPA: Asp-tRNA(Asn)/Glu-tRNA(Gln) amidotransferase subunit GatC [Levilinea sp.]|nr:Asp-tRNA(Asn)/Glu-tRNA(Gln) amidotransferase subunit GatC [Levilinea sp.]